MTPDEETLEAQRLLAGLESGTLSAGEANGIAERIDPVLAYFVIRYLREAYPASDPAANAVLQRVVRLMSSYPAVVRRCKQGEQDPVSRWFETDYSFRDFRGRGGELLELIARKLDS